MRKCAGKILWWICGYLIGGFSIRYLYKRNVSKLQNMSDKHLRLFLLMCRWVEIKQDGKELSSYFEQHGYERIAVYGMNYAGERLLKELSGSRTEVLYAIDQNADEIYTETKVLTMQDEFLGADAVVVTPVSHFGEIKQQLSKKVNCPIISLEDVLCGM